MLNLNRQTFGNVNIMEVIFYLFSARLCSSESSKTHQKKCFIITKYFTSFFAYLHPSINASG